ncbi:MAG: glycosyltransferase family 2 protein [Chlamydiae bacterium]|jgi:glycosyltransferase involved in cell wall biosynthesis|nr:glycosyltransferase family 2 protein [Chlamydiota bacterium]
MKKMILGMMIMLTWVNARVLLVEEIQPKRLSTSVIIPCAPSHFIHILNLLEHYNSQTVCPDEIIISLSECGKFCAPDMEEIENRSWNFALKIIKTEEKCAAGKNRNIAFSHTTKEIILLQDADDLPHPRRVEIVKALFETYKIEHLFHLWQPPGSVFKEYNEENLDCCYLEKYPYNPRVTNGHVCFLKSACGHIKWPENFFKTEDSDFNRMVYQDKSIKYKAIVYADLIEYRQYLSAN